MTTATGNYPSRENIDNSSSAIREFFDFCYYENLRAANIDPIDQLPLRRSDALQWDTSDAYNFINRWRTDGNDYLDGEPDDESPEGFVPPLALSGFVDAWPEYVRSQTRDEDLRAQTMAYIEDFFVDPTHDDLSLSDTEALTRVNGWYQEGGEGYDYTADFSALDFRDFDPAWREYQESEWRGAHTDEELIVMARRQIDQFFLTLVGPSHRPTRVPNRSPSDDDLLLNAEDARAHVNARAEYAFDCLEEYQLPQADEFEIAWHEFVQTHEGMR
jgi:hypothetical protein